MNCRANKSPTLKARNAECVNPCAPQPSTRKTTRLNTARRELRTVVDSLPTQLERDTLLTPEWVAESVVQETERVLKADLPADFVERLAAKAYRLYPRHRQFKQMLNRPGNAGRNNLCMYMRHWTAAWLKRERSALYKKLPWSFALGLPSTQK